MPLSRVTDWLRDGLSAYLGRDDPSLLTAGIAVVALVAGLVIAGITLSAYLLLVAVMLVVFLALYLLARGLLAGYRRLWG